MPDYETARLEIQGADMMPWEKREELDRLERDRVNNGFYKDAMLELMRRAYPDHRVDAMNLLNQLLVQLPDVVQRAEQYRTRLVQEGWIDSTDAKRVNLVPPLTEDQLKRMREAEAERVKLQDMIDAILARVALADRDYARSLYGSVSGEHRTPDKIHRWEQMLKERRLLSSLANKVVDALERK